jgi:hypothetical protein
MYITDLNGKRIEISNLKACLDQTAAMIGYFNTEESFSDFDELQQAYWKDILAKLEALAKLN